VELNLNGSGAGFKETARTGILKRASDVKALAQQTGVMVEVIKDLNGINGEAAPLKAYQPVRLPADAGEKVKELVAY
jgi:hypothetical protein